MKASQADNNNGIGRHLGQQSEYPEQYDPKLLVAIPRALNRSELGIGDALPFEGFDLWNAYEVSCLNDFGLPLSTVLRFKYSASSPDLVESKSLKLYLNSFNQEKLGADRASALHKLIKTIQYDLEALLDTPIEIWVAGRVCQDPHRLEHYPLLECLHPNLAVSDYTANAALLEIGNTPAKSLQVRSQLLRSRCRQTAQPDWGDIYLQMEGPEIPSTESLLRYIVSFRGENHFHEEIVETIFKDIMCRFRPTQLLVLAQYTRRGGIDINPLRATHGHALLAPLSDLERFVPTLRQ
ncbi:MAG: hypothetical protein JJU20_05995 [Opitutales bacterium]|nr:hypothetical protein [Opitutales bacterium]